MRENNIHSGTWEPWILPWGLQNIENPNSPDLGAYGRGKSLNIEIIKRSELKNSTVEKPKLIIC